jgi:nucleolar protein 14
MAVKEALKTQKKANVVIDKRIGVQRHDNNMSAEEQNLARLVRERTRRSKRSTKFSLNDDDDNDRHILTHHGKAVNEMTAAEIHDDHVMLSDDEEAVDGDLDAFDTETLHFGGNRSSMASSSIYGDAGKRMDMSTLYSQKKMDLDDMIQRRKLLKAEKLRSKELQHDTFQAMDDEFAQLSEYLQFRDKEKDIREQLERKRAGTLSAVDQEFADWDYEMKQYMYSTTQKVKATDRTKTPQEIAQEECDRLHQLETRRLARMNGDFDDSDDLSEDDSDSDGSDKHRRRKKKRRKKSNSSKNHPEALDNDSDDEDNEHDDDDELQVRFTADGLVHVNKQGLIVGKVGADNSDGGRDSKNTVQQQGNTMTTTTTVDDDTAMYHPAVVGTRVIASYRAREQYDGNETWFGGVITNVHRTTNNNDDETAEAITYDIEYDDGDFEHGVEPQHVKIDIEKTKLATEEAIARNDKEVALKRKRQKAQEKARYVYTCLHC